MGEPLLGFVDAGNVSGWNPPQRQIRSGELREPLVPLPQQFGVHGAIHVIPQRFDTFPYRHVHENAIVVVGAEIGRVSLGGLQAPYESRSAIGKRIEFVEARDEARHLRIV